ncbi:MAG: hypothetical protein SVR08_14665, partial [Spirochaetota bacterium]|nr:hypothetical protein [Spirochaetota bacterium]
MYLIKGCPLCKRMLRFPIDKGDIVIKCICGHSFKVSPDDPELYKDAKFDLTINKKNKKKSILDFDIKDLSSKLINKYFNLKYNIQNFRLLPTQEQH